MTMRTERRLTKFVVCVRKDDSEDLEPRKVYQVLPDRDAGREGYVRVIDESGEDYLYPAEYFVPVVLPLAIAREFAFPSDQPLRPTAKRARHG